MKINFSLLSLLSIFLFSYCGKKDSASSQKSTEETKPNIIMIMTDDQGWFDAGFNGNKVIQTPNLDKLANKGVVLERFYSASAVCSPTRASFITGRNPLRTDIPWANEGSLRKGEITIAELLKEKGYATGHYGKWHLGILTTDTLDANRGGKDEFKEHFTIPTEHGYDEYFATESKVPTYDPLVYPAKFEKDETLRDGWDAVEEGEDVVNFGTEYWTGEKQMVTENLKGDDSRVIMDRVIPFVEKSVNAKKSFFSTIWFHTPHLPIVADSAHQAMYKGLELQERLYYGTITAMDDQVGRLWEKLEELGVADNTILFFCSDNGPEVRTFGSAGIYREKKRSLYEGGVRVPAFAVWKDHFKAGSKTQYPAVTSDYLPTIVEALGLEFPKDRILDGKSILSTLKNGGDSLRNKPIGFIVRKNNSWVNDQYKLLYIGEEDKYELYDLINDPSENTNIIAKKPEVAEKMKAELKEWLASVENSRTGGDYPLN